MNKENDKSKKEERRRRSQKGRHKGIMEETHTCRPKITQAETTYEYLMDRITKGIVEERKERNCDSELKSKRIIMK